MNDTTLKLALFMTVLTVIAIIGFYPYALKLERENCKGDFVKTRVYPPRFKCITEEDKQMFKKKVKEHVEINMHPEYEALDFIIGEIYVIEKRSWPSHNIENWDWHGSLIKINGYENGIIFAEVVHVSENPHYFKTSFDDKIVLNPLVKEYAEAVEWFSGKTPEQLFAEKKSAAL